MAPYILMGHWAHDPNNLQRQRRTWSNNGVHVTLDTVSFGFPPVAATTTPVQRIAQMPRRSRSGSNALLGLFAGLVDEALAAQDSRAARADTHDAAHGRRRREAEFDTDARESYGRAGEDGRRAHRQHYVHSSREGEPSSRRSTSDRYSSRPGVSREASATEADIIKALEVAVEHHAAQTSRLEHALRLETRMEHPNPRRIDLIRRELSKSQEALNDARYGLERNRARHRRHSVRERPSPTLPPEATRPAEHDHDEGFTRRRSRTFTHPAPAADPFQAHRQFFNQFENTFFGGFGFASANSFTRESWLGEDMMPDPFNIHGAFFNHFPFINVQTAGAQQHPRGHARNNVPPMRGFGASPTTTPMKPPATVMTTAEAQRIFQVYDARWSKLLESDGVSDPAIPYPCRGMQAAGLLARDTLWAPTVASPVAEWSDETVMRANAQALFLGACGLAPSYSQSLGRVETSLDKRAATPAQLQTLNEILKNEKKRWHSDRLGRRNGGREGVNETLQNDERARAVFHAVCELMEAAQ